LTLSNEVKVGALAIFAIGLLFFGFNYLKGKNIFTASNSYYIEYNDVAGMTTGAMVMINGFQVGSVTDIYIKPNTNNHLEVEVILNRGIEIPPNTVANIFSPDPLSGKAIRLLFDKQCNGSSVPCAPSGSKLKGTSTGLIASMTGDLTPQIEKAKGVYQNLVDSVKTKLGGGNGKGKEIMKDVEESMADLQSTLKNLDRATGKLDILLGKSTSQLDQILGNVNSLTGNLKNNNQKITNILTNAESFTGDLKGLQLKKTLDSANGAIAGLDGTMRKADEAVSELQGLLKKVSEGNGTVAQLLDDDKLYVNINNAVRDLDFLLKDFRLNPKRYVNVSIIGRKPKPYTGVGDDPEGFQE